VAKICKSTKTIQGCGAEKPLSEFHRTKKYYESVCNDCRSKHRREAYRMKAENKKLTAKLICGAW